jgi:hypothetical protein
LKIDRFESNIYRIPLSTPVEAASHGVMSEFDMVVVRLRDSDGVEGCGYTVLHAGHGASVKAIIDNVFCWLRYGGVLSRKPVKGKTVRARFMGWVCIPKPPCYLNGGKISRFIGRFAQLIGRFAQLMNFYAAIRGNTLIPLSDDIVKHTTPLYKPTFRPTTSLCV